MCRARSSRASTAACLLLALPAAGPVARAHAAEAEAARPAAERVTIRLPAVARVARTVAYARAAPSGSARVRRELRPLRPDYRPRVLLVDRRRRDAQGRLWYRVHLPGRPNGQRGWVVAERLDVRNRYTRILVRRRARTLTVWRRGRRVLHTRVAVGKPGAETPLGRFYVTMRFRPSARFPYLGDYAMETSAYSKLSDWPGGGIVGIHGTNQPELLGQAVSHGCIRVSNRAIRRLRRLVQAGTPIRIVR